MTDGNLITGLLDLDVLVADEARRLDLENQLSVDSVRFAFVRRALHDWVELLLVNELINLKSAAVTGVDGHLHTWLHVTGARHDSPNGD